MQQDFLFGLTFVGWFPQRLILKTHERNGWIKQAWQRILHHVIPVESLHENKQLAQIRSS